MEEYTRIIIEDYCAKYKTDPRFQKLAKLVNLPVDTVKKKLQILKDKNIVRIGISRVPPPMPIPPTVPPIIPAKSLNKIFIKFLLCCVIS